ncbi:hypothetical protein Syun_023545 [Stephania yunnanensis]|uniref:Uncharacterized protein n=1 Tax=Stephania yunnanensis TaxID=152371 RepID=A0AAP0I3U6_9MAGN
MHSLPSIKYFSKASLISSALSSFINPTNSSTSSIPSPSMSNAFTIASTSSCAPSSSPTTARHRRKSFADILPSPSSSNLWKTHSNPPCPNILHYELIRCSVDDGLLYIWTVPRFKRYLF